MDEATFRSRIEQDLAPLLEGTVSPDSIPSGTRDHLASYEHPCRLVVKPTMDANFRVAIERSQKFEPHEKLLAEQFIEELATVIALDAGDFQDDLIQTIPRRVVAKHLEGGQVLRGVLERLETWSSQTYEGQRIVAAIGIMPETSASTVALSDYWEQDFGPVLSNGFDTLIEVSSNGAISALTQLDDSEAPAYAPYRLRQIASWADGDRISVALNRNGEVLVFKGQELRFLRRHGQWSHYSHETNVRRLSPPQNRDLRSAIYESCLDVSFARSGGCLGVIENGKVREYEDMVSDGDKIGVGESYKTRLLAPALNDPFQDLDRRLRQELLSMDGAVITDHRGNVLAVGAIIEVPPGSVGGGGRLAAAKQLSSIGVGVKISEDGTIRGFRAGDEIFKA